MSLSKIHIPSIRQFRRDTRLLLISAGILSLGIFGIQTLIKVLYILRLGYGLEYVGLFAATPALAFMAMSLPSGALGNRFGLKPMIITGAAISTSGMLLLPLTEFVPAWATDGWPILCQILTMAGWAMFEINMVPALMAATTAETRDNAYALMSMLRGAGTFIGTIVGGFLPLIFALLLNQSQELPDPYRWSLLVGASFGLMGILLLFKVSQVDAEIIDATATIHGRFPTKIVAFAVMHVFLQHGGVATCIAFGNAYMDTYLHLSAATIGLLIGTAQFFAIFAPIMMPVLVARHSNTWTMMVTSLGVAVFMLPLALIPNWFAAVVGLSGVLALMAIWMPTIQVFQMKTIEQHWRSLAYGMVAMGMSSSFGITSLLGGFVAAYFGYSALFLIGGTMSAIGGGIMWAYQTVPSFKNWLLPVPLLTSEPVLQLSTSEEQTTVPESM